MKVINIYRFDYETNNMTWKAFIAAYSNEEAENLLFEKVGKKIRVTSTGFQCRIDILHGDVVNDIIQENKPNKKKPGRPPKEESVRKE